MADIPPVDDYFGVCPACLTAGACNIGRTNWMYCKEHRVKWQVGENLFSGSGEQTEEQWFENHKLLKDFREIEPHSSRMNNPANGALRPCACERCIAPVLAAIAATKE
jgi:hypothetical protein